MKALVLILSMSLALSACVSDHELAPGKSPTDAAAVNVQLAIAYLQRNNLAVARKFIERALRQDSDSASVQATAGLIYERAGQPSNARHAYQEAARLGKGDPDIMNTYAGYLCRTQRAAEGEKLFLQVARNPLYQTPEVALVNAGVCLQGAGNYDKAERYFQRALEIRPNMPEALLESGALAFKRKDPQQAAEIVQRYLSVDAPTAAVLWLGIRAERALGHDGAAAAYAQRLQKEFPASNEARMIQAGVPR
ncbi:MAG TPA: type IV pilus biogenesis/stability protein PilW [Steroidobacteraceae bacterium]|nr:type IV pilus biogenesis/stability protein PilW [Steroidobacteraceae bacterium]